MPTFDVLFLCMGCDHLDEKLIFKNGMTQKWLNDYIIFLPVKYQSYIGGMERLGPE